MRDYGKVSPQFWVGRTGKALRGDLPAQIVALYLMTSPHANMIGVFYCPIEYIAKETGLAVEGASEALARLSAADFCTYDAESEWVFVHRFAANQIGEELTPNDKRVKGVINELDKVPPGACRDSFRARYCIAFHLPMPHTSPSEAAQEAPSKPLASQKQKQKQEQKEDGASPFVLPDWIPGEAWDGYVAMRAKIRKPMTDRARALVIKELDRLRTEESQNVGAMLDRSTVKNWTDVYPVKGAPVATEDPFGLKSAV